MFIVSVNCDLDEALRTLGHEVRSLSLTKPGLHTLRSLLDEEREPDCILQKEHLGARVLFSDLATFSCIKAFWSIDTHLNYYWQRHYGRVFDAFFTPHPRYLTELTPAWLHPGTFRLPACGRDRHWTPHEQRTQALSFVGRLTEDRTLRRNFCGTLRRCYQVEPVDGLTHEQMMGLYDQTRIIPNESIAFETNFRLLEGASSGCCVISPFVGEDQDALLEPGKEILVYRDGLEFLHLVDQNLKHPDQAERIGLAARARIQAEHLPSHRAKSLVRALETLPRAAAHRAEAEDHFAMALCLLSLNKALKLPDLEAFSKRVFHDRPADLLIRLLAAVGDSSLQKARELVRQAKVLLAEAQTVTEYLKELAVACGGFALWAQNSADARFFYDSYETLNGRSSSCGNDCDCETLYGAWIDALILDGKHHSHGLQFEDGRCFSALDFILQWANAKPQDPAWACKLHAESALCHRLPQIVLTGMSRLRLHQPDSLETSIEYIHAALRMFNFPAAHGEYTSLIALAQNRGVEPQIHRLLRLRLPHSDLLSAVFPVGQLADESKDGMLT